MCLVGGIFSSSALTFNPDTLYSRWIIDSRMGDFMNKGESHSFKTPTNYIHGATTLDAKWDYVPGLVAKAILKHGNNTKMSLLHNITLMEYKIMQIILLQS